MPKYFIDKYEIERWQQGFTLKVGISRPANAPKYKQTKADRERTMYVNKINAELVGHYFSGWEEIYLYIKGVNNLGVYDTSRS